MIRNTIIKYYQQYKHIKLFSIAMFASIAVYLFTNSLSQSWPYPVGDAVEYLLVSEAISKHGSPEVHPEDVQNFKNEVQKTMGWEGMGKHEVFDEFSHNLETVKFKHMDQTMGFAVSENQKFYSIHFFTYPLFTVPVKLLLKPFNIHPLKVFFIANALFILTALYFVLFFFPFKEIYNCLIAGFFFYSTTQWYMMWPHAEVWASSMIFIGVLLYYFKRPYLGILLCALAATQFQPLSVLVAVMVIFNLFENKFKLNAIIKSGLSSFWVIIPSLFYYYHFGVSNLVNQYGFLDDKFVTYDRVLGFFIDLNQGLIVSFPILFFVYLLFYFLDICTRVTNRAFKLSLFDIVPFAMIVMVAIASSMGNWNHCHTVNSRYAAYIGTVMLCHFIVLFLSVKSKKWVQVTSVFILITQGFAINEFGGPAPDLWSAERHKKGARFVLNNFPEYYNPDPIIFGVRTLGTYNLEHDYYKGVVYSDGCKNFKKAMVNKEHLKEVTMGGLTAEQLERLISSKHDQYGWVYVNEYDIETKLNKEESQKFFAEMKK